MGHDFETVITYLTTTRNEVLRPWGINAQADRITGFLHEARSLLATFDDPHAANAFNHTSQAIDLINNASSGSCLQATSTCQALAARLRQ